MAVETATTVTKGSCPVCPRSCHILVHREGDRITKVVRDRESRMTPGLCARVVATADYHENPARLNYPLKRVGARGEGTWERIAWDQAMDEIGAKLAEIRDQDGPEAIAVLGGGWTHHPKDPAIWKWCNLLGTPNVIQQGKNCGEAEFLAECAMYGYDTSGSNPVRGKTKVAIMWGRNPADCDEIGFRGWLKTKQAGTKMVVVDPRPTGTAKAADIWVRVRPGSDGALALGMLSVIINRQLYDAEFVARWCLGFDELKRLVQEYPPERVAAITWVPVEQIVEVATLYATQKPSFLSWGLANGQMGRAGLSAVLGKSWLRAVTGNLDVEGGNRLGDPPEFTAWLDEVDWYRQVDHPLRRRDNVSAHRWPIASVRALARYRDAMQNVYPKGYGLAQYIIYPSPHYLWTAILEEDPYPVKAVLTSGTNTLCCLANGKLAYRAFKSENLLLSVNMDHFMTPTAALADYVLPATDNLERPNLTNPHSRFNTYFGRQAAVPPLHERRDDYDLWRDLGRRIGQAEHWSETMEQWFDRILAPAGQTFQEFAVGPGYVPPKRWQRYEEQGFGTFSGKVELVPSLMTEMGIDPLAGFEEPTWSPVSTPELARAFPLILISGSRTRPYAWAGHKLLAQIRGRAPEPMVEISPETARKLGIAAGDVVVVETPAGSIRQRAELVEGLHPDVVHAEGLWWFPEQPGADPSLFGVWDANINAIIPDDPELCDYTGDSAFRGLLCRVYKAKEFRSI